MRTIIGESEHLLNAIASVKGVIAGQGICTNVPVTLGVILRCLMSSILSLPTSTIYYIVVLVKVRRAIYAASGVPYYMTDYTLQKGGGLFLCIPTPSPSRIRNLIRNGGYC